MQLVNCQLHNGNIVIAHGLWDLKLPRSLREAFLSRVLSPSQHILWKLQLHLHHAKPNTDLQQHLNAVTSEKHGLSSQDRAAAALRAP